MTQADAKPKRGFAGLEAMVSAPGSPTEGVAQTAKQETTPRPGGSLPPGAVSRSPSFVVTPAKETNVPPPRKAVSFKNVLWIASVVVLLIAILHQASQRGTSTSARPTNSARSAASSNQIPVAPTNFGQAPLPRESGTNQRQQTLADLKRTIESGRAQINALELQITELDSEIDRLRRQINYYKDEIERMKRDANMGFDVDEFSYNSAVSGHNALIARYNRLVRDRSFYYAQYQSALEQDHRLVAQYNSLIR